MWEVSFRIYQKCIDSFKTRGSKSSGRRWMLGRLKRNNIGWSTTSYDLYDEVTTMLVRMERGLETFGPGSSSALFDDLEVKNRVL